MSLSQVIQIQSLEHLHFLSSGDAGTFLATDWTNKFEFKEEILAFQVEGPSLGTRVGTI